MFDDSNSFISRAFLRSALHGEFIAYQNSGRDSHVRTTLKNWDARANRTEVQLEAPFIEAMFRGLWGYTATGQTPERQHTLEPKFRVRGAGPAGAEGEADLALGWFRPGPAPVPQVLCEFKDIRSGLDAPQRRKGSDRSPVQQCLAYLRGARANFFGNEALVPWWGLVTDMNEFRLYWWDRAPSQFMRFVIRKPDDLLASPYDLLSDSGEAQFDRFLFSHLFHRDTLLGTAGKPPLLRLVEKQWVREEKLEEEFYETYRAVRERLFNALTVANPGYADRRRDLLHLTQKLLDRFIFAFYCEDMGSRMLFPPQMLREHMQSRSIEPHYDPNGNELWEFFKRLFGVMNTGGQFGTLEIPQINGGLFAADFEIESLVVPNFVFAAQGQGASEEALATDTETIFYLCARYNFAASGDAEESISLYTLGRIFEQSITELEYRAGELEGRASIAELSKRKRDGVYYTPEWVVDYLVENTLGPWFAAAREACEAIAKGKEREKSAALAYEARLQRMRIIDPACGSGAFLISAFRRLRDERVFLRRKIDELEGRKIPLTQTVRDVTAHVLANNIYGVDINPASVEITKLALWLHSARADSPLAPLNHMIRVGNSLIAPSALQHFPPTDGIRERVNAFDWQASFPEVWPEGEPGGFDVVLGNPPYVKLQNYRSAYPQEAEFLQSQQSGYRSTQTQNFDLYLPFVEKGLKLLAPHGRMAYIAPSLWTVNEYGAGLRQLVADGRHLERWVDFKAHQIFAEAITYTALQFFTKDRQSHMRIAPAPDGRISDIDWSNPELAVPYDRLVPDSEWLMATGTERALVERLSRDCRRLDDPMVTTAIFQGLITSADDIYHLEKIETGRFRCTPKNRGGMGPFDVEIEEALMKPLVSGAEAKRYEEPVTNTYLLFPYERTQTCAMRLVPAADMASRYPKAWRFLQRFEQPLRQRENGKMDHPKWYGYVYPKNLDKHDQPKLVIPRLVDHLRVSLDDDGVYSLDNVDVGGAIAASACDPAFLLACLNSPVADFVFRLIAKPFRGDYRSANKQFIAPLPIPEATKAQQVEVAKRARELQKLWTNRRDIVRMASERLDTLARQEHGMQFLWPDLPSRDAAMAQAPANLTRGQRTKWIKEHLAELEQQKLDALQSDLSIRSDMTVTFRDGELGLRTGGRPILGRIYLDEGPGEAAATYWQWLLLKSGRPANAKTFASELAKPPATLDNAAGRQFRKLVSELETTNAEISEAEDRLNTLLDGLYALTSDERKLVYSA